MKTRNRIHSKVFKTFVATQNKWKLIEITKCRAELMSRRSSQSIIWQSSGQPENSFVVWNQIILYICATFAPLRKWNKLVIIKWQRNEKVEFLHHTNGKSWTIEKVDFLTWVGQVSNLVTPNTILFLYKCFGDHTNWLFSILYDYHPSYSKTSTCSHSSSFDIHKFAIRYSQSTKWGLSEYHCLNVK